MSSYPSFVPRGPAGAAGPSWITPFALVAYVNQPVVYSDNNHYTLGIKFRVMETIVVTGLDVLYFGNGATEETVTAAIWALDGPGASDTVPLASGDAVGPASATKILLQAVFTAPITLNTGVTYIATYTNASRGIWILSTDPQSPTRQTNYGIVQAFGQGWYGFGFSRPWALSADNLYPIDFRL